MKGGSSSDDHSLLLLPQQISFELHYAYDSHHPRYLADLVLFWERLYEAGYRVVSREDNRVPVARHCSEFTVVRTMC